MTFLSLLRCTYLGNFLFSFLGIVWLSSLHACCGDVAPEEVAGLDSVRTATDSVQEAYQRHPGVAHTLV